MTNFVSHVHYKKKKLKDYKTDHDQLTISDQNFFYNTDRTDKICQFCLILN